MIQLNKLELSGASGAGMTAAEKQQLAANTADITSIKENQATVNDITTIMESLPDGSAVSAQVALNTEDISTVKTGLDSVNNLSEETSAKLEGGKVMTDCSSLLTITKYYLIQGANGNKGYDTIRAHISAAVEPGETIKITCEPKATSQNNETVGYAFFDESDTFVSGGYYPYSETQYNTLRTITVPSGAVTIKASVYIDTDTYGKYEFYKKVAVPGLTNEFNTFKTDISDDVLGIQTQFGYEIAYFSELDLKFELGAINYSTGEDITESSDVFYRTDFIPVDRSEKSIEVLVPTFYSASNRNEGLAFYDENKTFISGYRNTSNVGSWKVSKDVVEIPEGAKYLRTCMVSEYTYTWTLTIGTNDALIPSNTFLRNEVSTIDGILYKNVQLTEVYYDNNIAIGDGGGSIIHGGCITKYYNVSSYVGKTLNIVNDSIYKEYYKYGFYSEKSVDSSCLIKLGTKNVCINENVVVPEGASYLITCAGGAQFPAESSVTLIQTAIDMMPSVDTSGYATTLEGWSRPTYPTSYNTMHFARSRAMIENGGIVFGGANLLFGKKIVTMGDSLLNAGSCALGGYLSLISGTYTESFNGGGSQTRPRDSQYINNTWSSGQDRAIKLVESGYVPDIILYENVNDRPQGGLEANNFGTLADKPFMLSQYIDVSTTYSSKTEAVNAWTSNFSTIVSSATAKKGTIVRLKYGSTAYNITVSGTASSDGTIVVNIGSNAYSTNVSTGDTASTIASNMSVWNFEGFTASAENGVLTLTSDGTNTNTPSVSSNASGVSASVSNSSSYSWIFRYFVGYGSTQFKDASYWTEQVPSLYACYKGLVEYLITNFPTARLVLLGTTAPFAKNDYTGQSYTFDDGSVDIYKYRNEESTTAWYDEKLRELQGNVANLYGLKFIDLDKSCNINLINFLTYYSQDDVHPKGTAAEERWAEVIYHELLM